MIYIYDLISRTCPLAADFCLQEPITGSSETASGGEDPKSHLIFRCLWQDPTMAYEESTSGDDEESPMILIHYSESLCGGGAGSKSCPRDCIAILNWPLNARLIKLLRSLKKRSFLFQVLGEHRIFLCE